MICNAEIVERSLCLARADSGVSSAVQTEMIVIEVLVSGVDVIESE